MLGRGWSEALDYYHDLFLFVHPWSFSYWWQSHSDVDSPHVIAFYPNHVFDTRAVRSEPIVVKHENPYLISDLLAMRLLKSPQLDDTLVCMVRGDVEFFVGDTKIALYLQGPDLLLFTDLTHTLSPGGVYLVDWVLSELKRLFDSGQVPRKFKAVTFTANLEISRLPFSSVYLFDGQTMHEFRTSGGIKRLREVKDVNKLVTLIVDGIMAKYRHELYNLFENVKLTLDDLTSALRGTNVSSVFPFVRALIDKGFVLVMNKEDGAERVSILFGFKYCPKRIVKDDLAVLIPDELRDRYDVDVFTGNLEFEVSPDRDGLHVDRIYIWKDGWRLQYRLPHYSPELGVCLGDVPAKLHYDYIPSVNDFFNETVKPVAKGLELVNLDSAYDCEETDKYTRMFEEAELMARGATTIWHVEINEEEPEDEEEEEEEYEDMVWGEEGEEL